MNELEKAKQSALARANATPIIKVTVEPEAVLVKEKINFTARFFARNPSNPLAIEPFEPVRPVVELVGKPAEGEKPVTYLEKRDKEVYGCQITPTVPGTHSYRVKDREEADVGELVEVEVLTQDADSRFREFVRRLLSGQL